MTNKTQPRWSMRVPFLELVVGCSSCHAVTFVAYAAEIPGWTDPVRSECCPQCGSDEIGIDEFDPAKATHLAAWSRYYPEDDPASQPWAAEFGIRR